MNTHSRDIILQMTMAAVLDIVWGVGCYNEIFQRLLEEDFVDKGVNSSVDMACVKILLSRKTEMKTSCLRKNRMLYKAFFLINVKLRVSLLPGPSRRLAPVIKCRRFLSFFQRYIVRDIPLTWHISVARYFWECSLAHWNLIRRFEKHVPQPLRWTSLWAKI